MCLKCIKFTEKLFLPHRKCTAAFTIEIFLSVCIFIKIMWSMWAHTKQQNHRSQIVIKVSYPHVIALLRHPSKMYENDCKCAPLWSLHTIQNGGLFARLIDNHFLEHFCACHYVFLGCSEMMTVTILLERCNIALGLLLRSALHVHCSWH